MKYSVYSLLIIAFLFFIPCSVRAGFVVKNHIAATAVIANSTANNTAASILNKQDHHSHLFNTIKKLTHPMMMYRRQPSEWVGIIALFSGVLGLFIPGINFLAILLGALGMGRRCNTKGLAVAGFILGVLELLFFLIVGGTIVSAIF